MPESLAVLRREVGAFAESHGVDGSQLQDLLVAVSEAATNVIVHAYIDADAGGEVEVAAEALDGAVVVAVNDRGRGMGYRPDSPGLGIGLPLIGQLATEVDIRNLQPGTEVRMTFAVSEVRGRAEDLNPEQRLALLSKIVGSSSREAGRRAATTSSWPCWCPRWPMPAPSTSCLTGASRRGSARLWTALPNNRTGLHRAGRRNRRSTR